MVGNATKIFKKMKSKGQFSIEKIVLECKKIIYNAKNKKQLILLLMMTDHPIKFFFLNFCLYVKCFIKFDVFLFHGLIPKIKEIQK